MSQDVTMTASDATKADAQAGAKEEEPKKSSFLSRRGEELEGTWKKNSSLLTKHKDWGNVHFKSGNYKSWIEGYTAGIKAFHNASIDMQVEAREKYINTSDVDWWVERFRRDNTMTLGSLYTNR